LGESSKLSVSEARRLQRKIADMATFEDLLPSKLSYVAGADAAYTRGLVFAGLAVLDYKTLKEVEVKTATVEETFPYVPSLLSFREAPALSKVLSKTEARPDVLIVDGHGAAHPYRCGLATYVGVTEGIPAIGVAKSLLWGEVGAFDPEGRAPITGGSEVIGAALNTSTSKPIYVSVGSNINLKRAIEIVRHCTVGRRLPEPLFRAHLAANFAKATFLRSGRI